MNNLLSTFIFHMMLILILIIIGVSITIKKKKMYILSDIIIVILIASMLIIDIPLMKDLSQNETVEIVAVYVEDKGHQRGVGHHIIFKDGNKTVDFRVLRFTKIYNNLEIGKTYRIEYYINSKIIKNCVLVE